MMFTRIFKNPEFSKKMNSKSHGKKYFHQKKMQKLVVKTEKILFTFSKHFLKTDKQKRDIISDTNNVTN